MTWILNDYSYMNYINNINQNPITLNDQSKCGICTGNIISKSPTLQPTLNPTIITTAPTYYPSSTPTFSPTTGFPLCDSFEACYLQTYHTNETYIVNTKKM